MTIGQRIKERRKQLGITQEELSKKMGYSTKSTICRAEASQNLETDTVKKYADALLCTPAYLMGWEDIDGKPLNETIEHDSREGMILACFHRMNEDDKKKFINMAYIFSGMGGVYKDD